jgi:hypothetical protein
MFHLSVDAVRLAMRDIVLPACSHMEVCAGQDLFKRMCKVGTVLLQL